MTRWFSRTADLIAGGQDREGLSLLQTVLQSPDLRRVMPGLVLSAFLSNLLAIALPMAILQIMDRVVVNQSIETLVFLVVGIVVAIVIEAILRSINGLVTGWLGARFEHSSAVAALDRMMRVPMKRYQREEPGVYAERVLASTQVSAFYSGSALMVLLDLPFAAIFLFIIYVIGGWVVLVPMTLLAIFAVVIVRFGEWMRELIEKRHVVDGRRHNFIAEVLDNIHSVKTSTMEGLMLRRYERLQEANAEMGETLTNSTALASGLGTLFSQVMILCVVFAGAIVVTQGGMTNGGLAACMMLSVRALQPLRGVLGFWMRYQSFAAAHQRLSEVMAMPCADDAGKPEMPPLATMLELKDVSLSHTGKVDLFSGLSLKVPAGSCVVVRGDSGSGKSSLMALMCGLIEPDKGEALVDGKPLSSFAGVSVHRQIALLPQSSSVVAGTILDNMTMFDEGLNARALSIAREMGLDRVVAGMKLGYETQLGEGAATSIPEGVRQLITIVRALVTNPSIILFDEANIALDIEGDKMLRDYLAAQKGRVTMVLVTHRPSLANLADKTYVLSDKRLIEYAGEQARTGQQQEHAAGVEIAAERPAAIADLSSIVERQFAEVSDLSACIAPLLEAMSWQGSARELAEALPHLVPRLDVSGFCSIMANLDMMPKHFKDSLNSLDPRLLPCLFIPPGAPAMVIKAALPAGRWRAFDARTGKECDIEPHGEVGEVYVFRKTEATPVPQRLEGSWFGRLAWRLRRHILLAFLLTVVDSLLSLAPPLFVMSIYDRVLPTGDLVMGGSILFGAAIAVALDWVIRTLRGRVMAYIGGRTEYVLGSSVFERILNLPLTSTEGASVSRQVGRIKNLEGLRDFFLGPLAMLAFDL
ncbi:MAG: ATP-binding cassette domain-containing protein, partial [Rhodocyclales bacterium]|nr:ATP-binding cassette domain-containing protein [Rhodocyclales bacterium]